MDKIVRELQKNLIEMLAWFHEYCKTNGLRYYALGGTMLGAVRHKGFIPWDDDIDVGMPRSDYEKLISFIGNRKCNNYFVETFQSRDKDFRYPYAKLYNTKTTLVERTWPILKRGIFIDIFPLDGLGNTFEDSLRRWNEISMISNLLWARICSVRKNREIYKNLYVILAHCIPDIIARDEYKLHKMDNICKLSDFDEMKYGGNVFGNWGTKEIMKISIMGKPSLYKFEELEIYGAQDYESYLSSLYGNWRKLPPVDEQISHHDYIKVDLNSAYI